MLRLHLPRCISEFHWQILAHHFISWSAALLTDRDPSLHSLLGGKLILSQIDEARKNICLLSEFLSNKGCRSFYWRILSLSCSLAGRPEVSNEPAKNTDKSRWREGKKFQRRHSEAFSPITFYHDWRLSSTKNFAILLSGWHRKFVCSMGLSSWQLCYTHHPNSPAWLRRSE